MSRKIVLLGTLQLVTVCGFLALVCTSSSAPLRASGVTTSTPSIIPINSSTANQMRQLANLRSGDPWLVDVSFHPGGSYLAAVEYYTGNINVWDLQTGSKTMTLSPDSTQDHGYSVAFSPDGTLLASTKGAKLSLWRVESLVPPNIIPIRTLPAPDDERLGGVIFSPDSRVVAASSLNGAIYLWNIAAGTQPRTLKIDACYTFPKIGFSASKIASTDCDGNVLIWDSTSYDLLAQIEGNGPVAFDADGTVLAFWRYSQAQGKSIVLLDTRSLKILETFTTRSLINAEAVNDISFSPDNTVLAVGLAQEGGILLIDSRSFRDIKTLKTAAVERLKFSPDGALLASGHAYDGDAVAGAYIWGVGIR